MTRAMNFERYIVFLFFCNVVTAIRLVEVVTVLTGTYQRFMVKRVACTTFVTLWNAIQYVTNQRVCRHPQAMEHLIEIASPLLGPSLEGKNAVLTIP